MRPLFFLLVFLGACSPKTASQMSDNTSIPAEQVSQGIAGKVFWVEGNMMPAIGESEPDPNKANGRPVVRDIYIYQITNGKEARRVDGFYQNIQTKLVKKVTSNEKGEFVVSLPEGNYSIFTEEGEGLFANIFDGEGNIQPVTVESDSLSQITIKIDYQAAY